MERLAALETSDRESSKTRQPSQLFLGRKRWDGCSFWFAGFSESAVLVYTKNIDQFSSIISYWISHRSLKPRLSEVNRRMSTVGFEPTLYSF